MANWDTPKQAVADVMSKLSDDAEVIEIKAWRERGRVYCTTLIKYPSGIKAEHDIHDYYAPKQHCRSRCDC